MTVHHATLAAGRWRTFSFLDQMANIDSEVERALNWIQKGNPQYSERAFFRALELLDLTIADPRHVHRLRELTRIRELLVDYFQGSNEYGSSDELWRRYFGAFTRAARRNA